MELRIVAQGGEDVLEGGGAEERSRDLEVLGCQPIDLLEPDLVDLFGLERKGRVALDETGVHEVAVGEIAETGLVVGSCDRADLVPNHVPIPGICRSDGVGDDLLGVLTPCVTVGIGVVGRHLRREEGVVIEIGAEDLVDLGDGSVDGELCVHPPGSDTLSQAIGELIDLDRNGAVLVEHLLGMLGGLHRHLRDHHRVHRLDPEDGIDAELCSVHLQDPGGRLALEDERLARHLVGGGEGCRVERTGAHGEGTACGDVSVLACPRGILDPIHVPVVAVHVGGRGAGLEYVLPVLVGKLAQFGVHLTPRVAVWHQSYWRARCCLPSRSVLVTVQFLGR